MSDRSLDEFLGGGSDSKTDADDAGDDDEAPDEATVNEPEPAASTTAFAPEGAACASCGATVRRRWRDDGELVCGECKAWQSPQE